MKVGMPILFEYNSLIENVDFAIANGFDFIELNLNFNYCRDDLLKKDVIEYLINSNLEFTIHFFDEFDAASYDEVVDAYINILEKYLEKAKDLNVKLLNIHLNEGPIVTISGNKNYLYEKEYHTYIKRLEENLNKIKEDYNPPLFIIGSSNEKIKSKAHIDIECESKIVKSFCLIVLVQILALEIATVLRKNVDKPHGLNKVVK